MTNTFKNGAKGSITTVQTIYTAPAATTSVVMGLIVANTSGADTTASVKVYDSSASLLVQLCALTPVPAASNLNVLSNNNRVVLETGDYITVTCAAACDAIASIMEVS